MKFVAGRDIFIFQILIIYFLVSSYNYFNRKSETSVTEAYLGPCHVSMIFLGK